MNKIYLPTLKSISIKNYSLYSTNISFDFIDGLNLIIGGNGVGKTTFVNIIRYALLGAYRKEIGVRTYKGAKKEGRTSYSANFFKDRMYSNLAGDKAEVTILFNIEDTCFKVTRALEELELREVFVTNENESYYLSGNIIKQHEYERLSEESKSSCLQYKYEELVAQKANLYDFNDMIFFINEILVFDEERELVLWNQILQDRLASKYFNDPELDNKYEESKRQMKYYNSLARHKSEDIKVINRLMTNMKKEEEKGEEVTDIEKANKIKGYIEKLLLNVNEIQNERKRIQEQVKIKNSEKTILSKKIQDMEEELRSEQAQIYAELWGNLNPDYSVYVENIKLNSSCPLCNKRLEPVVVKTITENQDQCILCQKPLQHTSEDNQRIAELVLQINCTLSEKQEIEAGIYKCERGLDKLDNEYKKYKNQLFLRQEELREIEHMLTIKDDETESDVSYKKMDLEIEKLEEEKKIFIEESQRYQNEADEMLKKIEVNLVEITRELSKLFSDFASGFLGMEAKLTYDAFDGELAKRYYPVIRNKHRGRADELSESQRFFVDHSFRMCLLSFFYQRPAFFICETPDSSLDISYEENAAKIFLKYLEKPNSLILTSNLNNSKFLDYIVDNCSKINVLNLLKHGNPSSVQANNKELSKIAKRIEEKVNEKG